MRERVGGSSTIMKICHKKTRIPTKARRVLRLHKVPAHVLRLHEVPAHVLLFYQVPAQRETRSGARTYSQMSLLYLKYRC